MKHLLSYFLIILIFPSCQLFVPKPESEKFYCKIAGFAYRPLSKGFYSLSYYNITSGLNRKNNSFYISTSRSMRSGNSESFNLDLKFEKLEDFRPKKYSMSSNITGQFSGKLISYEGKEIKDRFTSINSSGYLEFTKIDTVRRTVSGLFEFKAKSKYTDKRIKITNGQFNDLSYFEN